MTGNWKDSRLADGYSDFIVVYLIKGRCRTDDMFWDYLVFL